MRTGSGTRYSQLRAAAAEVHAWFNNLLAQLSATAPAVELPSLPDHHQVKIWAAGLAADTLRQVEAEMENLSEITVSTAFQVQRAVLVGLITGSFLPPLRLDLVRTLLTPDMSAERGCTDRDCLARQAGNICQGNCLEVVDR